MLCKRAMVSDSVRNGRVGRTQRSEQSLFAGRAGTSLVRNDRLVAQIGVGGMPLATVAARSNYLATEVQAATSQASRMRGLILCDSDRPTTMPDTAYTL